MRNKQAGPGREEGRVGEGRGGHAGERAGLALNYKAAKSVCLECGRSDLEIYFRTRT